MSQREDYVATLAAYWSLVARAGVTVSLTEWRNLDKDSQAALVVAQERHRFSVLEELVTALSGPRGLDLVRSKFDGGEAYNEAALVEAVRGLRAAV